MTRHSRNCTASSVYSYHEKKRDADASGYGSLAARYGKDGIKDFDCCCLCLHPCKDPLVSSEGYLFDREAVLEYIISKKNEIRKKLKEYEKQCKKDQAELHELGAAEERSRLQKFLQSQDHPASSSSAISSAAGSSSGSATKDADCPSISNMKGDLAKKLPSYWIPSLTPDNKQTRIPKPVDKVLCPMSNKPLKMKDLVPVKFTRIDPNASFSSLEGHKERYKCPVTGDVLRNAVPCAVLRPTGDVVTMEAVAVIRRDMKHPLTGHTLTERDIIPLQRGGTGFAAANETLAGKKARPVMQA
ncbi:nitric oxide synthase-interacting protein homolog [Hyalella azteca]|uniref:Nitric oxide synthase-interacting protein homolog n=1 Tax=Hyalella azteca TaxID=294128 RepID=A0A8B7N149_HYAAZ|nr:nitric oxide synthase-interacting protein homolog [Hyalella azteca]